MLHQQMFAHSSNLTWLEIHRLQFTIRKTSTDNGLRTAMLECRVYALVVQILLFKCSLGKDHCFLVWPLYNQQARAIFMGPRLPGYLDYQI